MLKSYNAAPDIPSSYFFTLPIQEEEVVEIFKTNNLDEIFCIDIDEPLYISDEITLDELKLLYDFYVDSCESGLSQFLYELSFIFFADSMEVMKHKNDFTVIKGCTKDDIGFYEMFVERRFGEINEKLIQYINFSRLSNKIYNGGGFYCNSSGVIKWSI